MSGWVDSAVTAHLLLKEGYEVIAWFMKNYADPDNPDCHTRKDRNMAIKCAQHLGIKTFVIFDFREEYHETIIKYIYNGYKKGYTPNPDVLCNSAIKFATFLDAAKNLWCDAIATGHYARIKHDKHGYKLLKGVDDNKDQSYFLSWLDQDQLAQSIFPLGWLTKETVREIAEAIWLPNADRKDSQWLCFIGKVSMKEFLAEALPKKPGKIVDTDWNHLGDHDWAWFYTLGQRQGLGLSGWPWFVVEKNVDENVVVVWPKKAPELFAQKLIAVDRHRVNDNHPPRLPLNASAKIRYRQADQDVTIDLHSAESVESGNTADTAEATDTAPSQESPTTMSLTFSQPQRAISPWQVVAIYDGDELLGSGIIKEAIKEAIHNTEEKNK